MEGGGRQGSRTFKDSSLKAAETNLWLILSFLIYLVDLLVTFFLDSGSGGVPPLSFPFLHHAHVNVIENSFVRSAALAAFLPAGLARGTHGGG